MGEIIKFPGAQKKEAAGLAEEKADEVQAGKIVNFAEVAKNKKRSGDEKKINEDRIVELLMLVSGLISGANGRPRGEAYQERRRLVNGYTDEQIVTWINNFDIHDVSARPLFYSALLDEAIARELFLSKK